MKGIVFLEVVKKWLAVSAFQLGVVLTAVYTVLVIMCLEVE
jgi:hypothetical protein